MYIVITEDKVLEITKTKKFRDVDTALKFMEEKIQNKLDCTLASIIDTDTEINVTVKISDHENY